MSEEDKNYVNEWDIIDTFFRDTDYYKSQHQIDSFDEFIFFDVLPESIPKSQRYRFCYKYT